MTMNKLNKIVLTGMLALPLVAVADAESGAQGEHPMHSRRAGPPGAGQEMPAMQGMHGMHGHGGRPGLPFMQGLSLTDEQDDKIFQIMHSAAPYLHEQQKAHQKAMRDLHEMRNAEKFDDAAAARLTQAAAQAQANIMLHHMRTHQKVLAVLTPEQRKRMQEQRPAHGPRFKGGMHER